MKKTILLVSIIFTCSVISAQVFNTGNTLQKGKVALGIEPAYLIDSYQGLYLFLHGGVGITSGIDLGVKIGIGQTNYFGADLEWRLAKNLSLATGAHSFGDFGLDGCLNYTIPLGSSARLFTGLDADINFGRDNLYVPIWLPLGVEVKMEKKLAFILETEIGLTSPAYHLIGGGVMIYF
jgi:hypothetical protein